VALKPLQRSERDFPKDYNPPNRLANIYMFMGRYEDAVGAAQRAIDRAYGPRKVQAYTTKAAALQQMGRREDALKTYDDAIAYGRTLAGKANLVASVEKLRARLAGETQLQ
jgi:tetratricopeptide (TPR) repeat protein